MITVQEADRIIGQHPGRTISKSVPLTESLNKVLDEDVTADRDFPPFTRVSMDGIAIQFQRFNEGHRTFNVETLQAAGEPAVTLMNPDGCIEVMTGAVLPENTDTVIRYEDLDIKDGKATVNVSDVRKGQNAHLKGLDRKEGDVIVQAGQLISPPEVAVLATVGMASVRVRELPEIAVVSSGDELVAVDQIPTEFQIRRSNVYALEAALKTRGYLSALYHLQDNKQHIREQLSHILDKHQIVMLSGGVSMGKFDYIPEILEELKITRHFHKVKQRPGKPFWFGSSEMNFVFAFPGNPVSSFMCLHRYFFPWAENAAGLAPQKEVATLSAGFSFEPGLQYFLQVKLFLESGRLMAEPVSGGGSGDLANLVDSDAFMELPMEQDRFHAGESFPVIRFR